tara:strand:- start:14 stop:235 length:222 start_codon:yes stop_codon:yes gene_type:complete
MSETIIYKSDVYVSKDMIEEILEQEVPDELYEKYEDNFIETISDNFYMEDGIKDCLGSCMGLRKLENELNDVE